MIIIPTEKRFDWNRKPYVLIGLLALNVLIYFWYQSGDQVKFERALTLYQPLIKLEWPLYQEYLEQQHKSDELAQVRNDYQQSPLLAASAMMTNPVFFQYLSTAMFKAQSYEDATAWLRAREQVNQHIGQLSWIRWGLIPTEIKTTHLLTYQFLHGGVMHLLGNMFFLLVCGFAVEAAIGHWRFLVFYLVSGIAGGLLHTLIKAESHMPLVGASGAIAGVMAMYLGVFMLRKIEFFYWFYVFVGYFRAPALIILPLYIGKEILSYLSDPEAEVAFMAHAGGFAMGALLMLANQRISPQTLNTDYIETPDVKPDEDPELIKILKQVENYQFDQALRSVNQAIKTRPDNFRLHLIRYNLCKIAGDALANRAAAGLLACVPSTTADQHQQLQLVRKNPDAIAFIKPEQLIELLARLCEQGETATAEKIFQTARDQGINRQQLMRLAVKLSQGFARLGQTPKSEEYQQQAIDLQDANS